MIGIIIAIISGLSMTIQGVFNTRLSEKIGLWETNCFAQLTAFLITIAITYFFGKGNFKALSSVNKIYLSTGLLGVIIIFTVIQSITALGTTFAVAIILVSQLTFAAIVDIFGLFGTTKINFTLKEFIGLAIIIIGIIVFKWKH